MDIMEIILLGAGGIIFILSFLIPEKRGAMGMTGPLAEQEIKNLVSQELEEVRTHVDDVVEEAVTYAIEKTERSLERLSNEKIMAVNEYSETVLAEIHKNHEEAVFLYDMLNNKHVSLKTALAEVNRAVKEAEEKIVSFQQAIHDGQQEEKTEEEISLTSEKAEEYPVQEVEPEQKISTDGADVLQEGDRQNYNNNERIVGLYREGKTAVEIARELELGIGEVKLVIDLFMSHKK